MVITLAVTLTGEAERVYRNWVKHEGSTLEEPASIMDEMASGTEADLRTAFETVMECVPGIDFSTTPEISVRALDIRE